MSYFRSLRKSLGSYIPLSPNAQESRVVPSSVSLDLDSHLEPETASPTRRTREWIKSNDTEKSNKKPNVLGVEGSKIAKSSSTNRPATTPGSASTPRGKILGLLSSWIYNKDSNEVADGLEGSSDELEDGLEGSTIIEDAPMDRSPGTADDTTLIEDDCREDHPRFATPSEDAATDSSPGTEDDTRLIEDEFTKDQDPFANPSDEVQTDDYTEDEMWLHQKLVRRGEEPLFHNAWGLDFPTFPEDLFTLDHSKIFIYSISDNDFHACKALEGLLFLPARVRDRVARKFPPEETIRREIDAYYKWSMDDARLTNIQHFPVLTIAAGSPKEPTSVLIGRVTDRLHQIGRQYRRLWIDKARSNEMEKEYTHDLPILYGIVIKYTVVTFVTYDAAMPQRPLRYLAQFNFAQRGQDVWNCLAAAIIVVRARNYLRGLQAEGELGREIKKKKVVDEDA